MDGADCSRAHRLHLLHVTGTLLALI